MRLKRLLEALDDAQVQNFQDTDITGIAYNSKTVQPGNLFAALPGQKAHGIYFVRQALKKGAAAVLTDFTLEVSCPVIVTPEPRRAMALLSNRFYRRPSKKLKLIGVTGTNGKTTVSYLVRSICEAAGVGCGLIGTIEYSGEKKTTPSSMTTPESVDLQQWLSQFLKEGIGACSMEVSSQGLDQHRVTGCAFAAAVFTNLTRDHLDYHKTMERYFNAKRMLFDSKYCQTKIAVVNNDDPYGKRIVERRKALKLRSVTFGFDKSADYYVTFWKSGFDGTDLVVRRKSEDVSIHTPLLGKYNVYNVAAAYAEMDALGFPRESLLQGIENMRAVPGRMEVLPTSHPFNVILDYAHTDDAFRQLLSTIRSCTSGRIIHVFGCRGARDQGKRLFMGRASGELADIIILTSDNPANENPERIARDILIGVRETANSAVHVVLDRGKAIERAMSLAKAGDTIVVTGKGNETYQLIKGEKFHFDDREHFLK